MSSSSSEFTCRITAHKDGQIYVVDLDFEDVTTVTAALAMANAATHYQLEKTLKLVEFLKEQDHSKFHETLDKMTTVLTGLPAKRCEGHFLRWA
jgi:hypothetical protein